jgi:hypothetical protein
MLWGGRGRASVPGTDIPIRHRRLATVCRNLVKCGGMALLGTTLNDAQPSGGGFRARATVDVQFHCLSSIPRRSARAGTFRIREQLARRRGGLENVRFRVRLPSPGASHAVFRKRRVRTAATAAVASERVRAAVPLTILIIFTAAAAPAFRRGAHRLRNHGQCGCRTLYNIARHDNVALAVAPVREVVAALILAAVNVLHQFASHLPPSAPSRRRRDLVQGRCRVPRRRRRPRNKSVNLQPVQWCDRAVKFLRHGRRRIDGPTRCLGRLACFTEDLHSSRHTFHDHVTAAACPPRRIHSRRRALHDGGLTFHRGWRATAASERDGGRRFHCV